MSVIVNGNWLKVGDLILNCESREVYRSGVPVKLSNKEFLILEYFMSRLGKTVTRVELLENIWDRNIDIFTNTVDVHIMNLRRKIDLPFTKPLIQTVYCVGYVMR